MIEFSNVSADYGETPILQNISLTIPKGSITTIIGPNGCGKTTLLRAAARQLRLQSGDIRLLGKAISDYSRTEYAKTAAFMPQVRSVPSITVQSLVSHGRFPYLGFSRKLRPYDREMIQTAMEQTGVTQWAKRDLRTLSGGERQRVYIAMALAQDTELIFLDEPTTYLDLGHQFELLELISALNQQGKTIVMVLHDLSHALRYSQYIALLNEGKLLEFGTPDCVAFGGKIQKVFHISLHIIKNSYIFTPSNT